MKTEEEQIAAIKNWWKKNGSSLLVGIGAALAIVFGWEAWQSHQAEQRSVAGARYQQLLVAANQPESAEGEKSIDYIAGQLQDDYEDSPYAVYATLILANHQFEKKDDPKAAVKSLEWALSKAGDGPLAMLITERLARAQFAAGKPDEALETLGDVDEAGSYKALYAELKGDILNARGDKDRARDAYRIARKASDGRNPVLQLKMSDLGIGEGA